jgi:hypothetical protein
VALYDQDTTAEGDFPIQVEPDIPDLDAAFEAHFAAIEKRGDEDLAHVADLYGCDRATWARRSGVEMIPHNNDTLTKFALGNAVEDFARKAFVENLPGWTVTSGDVVDLPGTYGTNLRGHLDLLATNDADPRQKFVIEVKSTTFFPRKDKFGKYVRVAPDEARYHYRLQAAGYACAVGAPWFAIVVVCRESGMRVIFYERSRVLFDDVRRRAREVAAITDPSKPEPAAEPPAHAEGRNGNWMCKFCGYAACERNANPERP